MSFAFRIAQSDIIKHYGNVNFCQLFNKKLIVFIKFHIKIYRLNNNSTTIIIYYRNNHKVNYTQINPLKNLLKKHKIINNKPK
ncbi:hypothetical protein B5C26_03560 [Photorhabdus luminescens]|uniref:Uncharacterized protein n=1 Tax=Photorhabdus luminescens subsp. mexicana TaxID=2100167 RepID=A0A4R4JJ01_PHOLU|nr:hypothetical protein B5C26_03560 [Photorhabdus luminescens]TDB53381.1 hypothetical protein C5468_06735 [Photorhabdus luminescens subsp. mexicana]